MEESKMCEFWFSHESVFLQTLNIKEVFLLQSLRPAHVADCVSWIYEILVLCLAHYLGQPHHPHCQPGKKQGNIEKAHQSICQLIKSVNRLINQSIKQSIKFILQATSLSMKWQAEYMYNACYIFIYISTDTVLSTTTKMLCIEIIPSEE